MVVNKANGNIICTNFADGRKHDFKVFKDSKVRINPKSKIVVDSGYQGLQKIHTNTMLPKKKKFKLYPENRLKLFNELDKPYLRPLMLHTANSNMKRNKK